MTALMNTPTYEELKEEIEILKLAIKLAESTEERESLKRELFYVEEYLEHILDKGRP